MYMITPRFPQKFFKNANFFHKQDKRNTSYDEKYIRDDNILMNFCGLRFLSH